MVLIAMVAAAPLMAQDVDWAALNYTLHRDFQAVDSDGNGTFPLTEPVKLRGVLLNWGDDLLAVAAGSDPFMGGQWQVYVQAVDLPNAPVDFGGTALFMMQNVGNINGDPNTNYPPAAWYAEMEDRKSVV